MLAADTGSLYFEAVPLSLRDTMWRVGAVVRPAEFVAAVVDAWRAVEIVTEEEVQARFRASRAWRDFSDVLRMAAMPGARVLAIGCGRGFAGRSSAYAASVVREVFHSAEVADIDRLDVTPELLSEAREPYDIVVTHSLLHFVYEFRPLCRLVQSLVAPGGAYVMANEHNSRFWSNPECVRAMKAAAAAESRQKRIRKLFDPARYWRRIQRLGRPKPSWSDRMNEILRARFHLTADLTQKEIARIIDPYMPDPFSGECPIGKDGMNWADLEGGALGQMRLERMVTSGYVMRSNPERLPQQWRAVDESLSAKFPLDGCSYTALWRKNA
jgi:SAM-dependent methyltransferase